MAGLILHGDLTAALSDAAVRTLTHRLESVKFLPPALSTQTTRKAMECLRRRRR